MSWSPSFSPRTLARITGAVYLVSGQAFSFSEFTVRGNLVVPGDAAATAHNILANEQLYRNGFAVGFLPLYLVVTFLLYLLLRPVNRSVNQLAYVFSVVGCTISAVTSLLHLGSLILLGDDSGSFSTQQLQSLALMLLAWSADGLNMAMVFFGFYCILLGYLIYRSSFLPRFIGVMLALAGVCYEVNSFAAFLAPAFHALIYPYILAPGIAELMLAFWLLLVGLNVERWNEEARLAAA